MTSYMNKDAPKTVIFIANRTYAIVSSRLNIVHKFLELGWDVVVVAKKDEFSHKLNSIGVDVVDFSFVRGSLSFSDLYSILRFPFVLFKLKPNLIHNFHAKPVILSTLLSRLLFRDNVTIINTITGLGYAFSKNGLLRMMSIFGYRLSLHRSNAVVFQNHDDKMLLNDLGLAVDNGYMIVSSGVDLSRFNYHSINPSLKVVMLGRLLWKKGVRDFVQVAEYFKNNNYDIEFCWGGNWNLIILTLSLTIGFSVMIILTILVLYMMSLVCSTRVLSFYARARIEKACHVCCWKLRPLLCL